MLTSLLVGLDDTPESAGAVELAVTWGQQHTALVVGLAAFDPQEVISNEPVPMGASAYKVDRDVALLEHYRKLQDHRIERFALRLANAGVSSKPLEAEGPLVDVFAREAQRYDLVLLGRRTRFLHGTSPDGDDGLISNFVRDLPRPVVLVPPVVPSQGTVVVAYDGSLQAARALQAYVGTGLGVGRTLHVVSVGTDTAQAIRHADRAIEYLHSHGLTAQPHALSGSPGTVILQQVSQCQAGLLVMGAYGQRTLREFLFGSVTQQLLAESNVPVFLAH